MNSNGSKSPKNAVISTKSAFSGVEKLEDSLKKEGVTIAEEVRHSALAADIAIGFRES